jgi:hypothetical protein
MIQEAKPVPPDALADDELAEEVVNDSLGTIDLADTADTDPDDDPEAGGKGIGDKVAE